MLGGLFFYLLLFGTHHGKFPLAAALLMLLIVIEERVGITPGMEMVRQHTRFQSRPIATGAAGGRRSEFPVQDGRVGEVRARSGVGSYAGLAGAPAVNRRPESSLCSR